MSNRFRVASDHFLWDRVNVIDVEHRGGNDQHIISVTGLVRGDDGALLFNLPGMVDRHFAMAPSEARALRDALKALVTDEEIGE